MRTTPYHPQSNGLIERWHRVFKSAIKCYEHERWVDTLPFVLLGLRSIYKEDLKSTVAEVVYGKTLMLPGEFFNVNKKIFYNSQFVEQLRRIMADIKPCKTSSHGSKKIFVHDELSKCSHVFLRNDAVHAPLQPNYSGPHLVLDRNSKVFKILVGGKKKTISVDRLKPAFMVVDFDCAMAPNQIVNPVADGSIVDPAVCDPIIGDKFLPVTRSGRNVRFPAKFHGYDVSTGGGVCGGRSGQ